MNWPESELSLTSAKARTMVAWPATKPMRQPIMLNPLDIEWISTPILHHHDLVRVGKINDLAIKSPRGHRLSWDCWDS